MMGGVNNFTSIFDDGDQEMDSMFEDKEDFDSAFFQNNMYPA